MSYVLVTPTKNEEAAIGHTLKSVISQTILPLEWVIVSDGSTDNTDEIIRTAAKNHPWIRLMVLPPRPKRSFAAVVHAMEAGVRALTTGKYEYIGLLDSDIRFEADYFEKLIEHFNVSPRLGLAGGVVIDPGQPRDRFPRNRNEVPGATHFFRRACFEKLGGLIAIPEGGWDTLTSVQARMRGYETHLVTNLVVDHLKPRNISEGGMLRRQWQMGIRDYTVGYNPIFEFVKCLSRLFEAPLFVGSVAWWFGYCYAAIHRHKRPIPKDLIEFLRAEQKRRLFGKLLPARDSIK